MKAIFLAWTKYREPLVWTGSSWVDSPTEKTHAAKGKKFDVSAAKAMLNDFRKRFGCLDEIIVLPLATMADVKELADQPGRRGKR